MTHKNNHNDIKGIQYTINTGLKYIDIKSRKLRKAINNIINNQNGRDAR